MSDTRETLIEEVYRCMHCAHLRLPFVACDDAGRAFRFPPTIGAMGTAPLLFVGINPRVSDSNRHLHDTLMHNYPTRPCQPHKFTLSGNTNLGMIGLDQRPLALREQV